MTAPVAGDDLFHGAQKEGRVDRPPRGQIDGVNSVTGAALLRGSLLLG